MLLGSDARTIFINPFGKTDGLSEGLKSFLAYLRGEVIRNSFAEQLDDVVQKARQHDEWRMEYMTLLMRDQENIEKGKREGKLEEKLTVAKTLLKNGWLSDEKIMQATNLSADELKKVKQELEEETV